MDIDSVSKNSAMGNLPIDFDSMKHLVISVRGVFFFIDKEDFGYFSSHSWYVLNGYLVYSKEGKPKFYHREIINTPENLLCDHINKIKNDNRKINLRHCSYSENAANHTKKNRIKGVKFRHNKYYSYYHIKQVRTHLGVFSTQEEAARAHDRKIVELYGEFATTNYPLSDYVLPTTPLCKTISDNPSKVLVNEKQTGRTVKEKGICSLCEKEETFGLMCKYHNTRYSYYLRSGKIGNREEFIIKFKDLPTGRKNCSTGIIGIQFYKKKNKYRAVIDKNKTRVIVGLFDSIEEAQEARDNYLKENKIEPLKKEDNKKCSLCDNNLYYSGLCQKHYMQERRKKIAAQEGRIFTPNEKKRNKIAREKYPVKD